MCLILLEGGCRGGSDSIMVKMLRTRAALEFTGSGCGILILKNESGMIVALSNESKQERITTLHKGSKSRRFL